MRAVLGDAVFFGDILATGGLDDQEKSSVLRRAEQLMADAVHAEHTFSSTCGSSLSVKAAMLSVAAAHQKLLVGRDAHKSVIARRGDGSECWRDQPHARGRPVDRG